MKIHHSSFPSKFKRLGMLARIAALSVPCLLAANAHATTSTGTFTTSMAVSGPACTVATNNPTIALPASTSAQTTNSYLSTNAITTVGAVGGAWVTAASLNQTATVTCLVASTPITSFAVGPASGASLYNSTTAVSYLVDTATTPNKAGTGSMLISYEQLSVNGTSAPFTYLGSSNNVSPYVTSFTTTAVANGIATVVWRPVLYNLGSAAMGTPTGGAFTAPGVITINY